MESAYAGKIKRPDHVPEELVFEFDYNNDPGYCANPHARTEELVKEAPPVFWTPYNGGHWMFMSHDAVAEALTDFNKFSSEHFSPEAFDAMMSELPEEERIPAPVPICIDPPLHSKLRQPLFATFSPKSVAAMEGKIRELAERLIDTIADQGYCEFQHDVSDVYPVEIFLAMFGLPVEKEREYRELAKQHLSVISPDLAENMLMMKAIADVLRDTVIDRKDNPKDDIISMLWSLNIEDEPMNLELMMSYCVILFIAGLDTVVNALGFGVRHLAEDMPLQRELRERPELIPQASEELLRRYAFVAPIRMVKQDSDFHGIRLAQGERIMMFIPGASIDESFYKNATTFDAHRDKLNHMAFGMGPHHCLGAHLARMELRVMYETLLSKLPEFKLDPDNPPAFHGSIIAGPTSIHLVWQGKDSTRHAKKPAVEKPVSAAQPSAEEAPATTAPPAAATPEPVASEHSGIEGIWSVTIHGPTGPQETTLELKKVDGILTGTQSAMGQVETATKLEYNADSGELSWVNKIRKPLPITLKFKGTVEGNTISGKVNAAIMGSFPFTAKRS